MTTFKSKRPTLYLQICIYHTQSSDTVNANYVQTCRVHRFGLDILQACVHQKGAQEEDHKALGRPVSGP